MLVVSISEAKNKLSALIDRVRGGETVTILDRGRPVARLEPAVGGTGDDEGRIARLERAGIIRRATGRLPEGFLDRELPQAEASVLEALLEERREGR
jgi:prevent-host-death family protein